MESRPRISPITSVTAHIIIQMVHIPLHRSHTSTLEYLRNKQTDNERPQSTIKDITAVTIGFRPKTGKLTLRGRNNNNWGK